MSSVLIIDDDRENWVYFLERAFRKFAPGLGVHPCYYGEDAIAHFGLFGTARPALDLILLDRFLPNGPGGLEVLRAIRALPALAAVPVCMLSA